MVTSRQLTFLELCVIVTLWSRKSSVIVKAGGRMYFAPKEHPPSHCHAYFGDHKGILDIRTCEVTAGDLPRRQVRLLEAWAELHKEELVA